MDVGQKIKNLREKKKISLREMGRRLNISYSYLSRIENGIQNPHIELLENIANILDVKTADFFIDEEKPKFNDSEKDLLGERILTPEKLKEKSYKFKIDGIEATQEEIEDMVNYIKALRIMKKISD